MIGKCYRSPLPSLSKITRPPDTTVCRADKADLRMPLLVKEIDRLYLRIERADLLPLGICRSAKENKQKDGNMFQYKDASTDKTLLGVISYQLHNGISVFSQYISVFLPIFLTMEK